LNDPIDWDADPLSDFGPEHPLHQPDNNAVADKDVKLFEPAVEEPFNMAMVLNIPNPNEDLAQLLNAMSYNDASTAVPANFLDNPHELQE